MLKSRRFWLLVTWGVVFSVGTGWVTVEGEAEFGNAALVGAVAASVVTAMVARVGK